MKAHLKLLHITFMFLAREVELCFNTRYFSSLIAISMVYDFKEA